MVNYFEKEKFEELFQLSQKAEELFSLLPAPSLRVIRRMRVLRRRLILYREMINCEVENHGFFKSMVAEFSSLEKEIKELNFTNSANLKELGKTMIKLFEEIVFPEEVIKAYF
ncbi:MAG TPA: hypothetical protein PKH95_01570 [Candidatus Magasanikbacteria bacterium]|nr:hypothetical protein [Candidatus Magasanikbacteria bacterium]